MGKLDKSDRLDKVDYKISRRKSNISIKAFSREQVFLSTSAATWSGRNTNRILYSS